jgi:hypothetical protein
MRVLLGTSNDREKLRGLGTDLRPTAVSHGLRYTADAFATHSLRMFTSGIDLEGTSCFLKIVATGAGARWEREGERESRHRWGSCGFEKSVCVVTRT